ncbi:MAG TPA: CBS domain-containing protein [Steroidobacteraceae bacterium]|jgi:CBS domain-containing protein
MQISEMMTRTIRVTKPDDTLQHAARLMAEADTGVLPVGENDRLVGMVTDRDIAIRGDARGCDPTRTRVREVMTPEVRYCFEDEDVESVARNMAQLQVRRLPVLSREKRLVGILSLADLSHRSDASTAGDTLRGVSSQSAKHSQSVG